jgi:hypothetical protein
MGRTSAGWASWRSREEGAEQGAGVPAGELHGELEE